MKVGGGERGGLRDGKDTTRVLMADEGFVETGGKHLLVGVIGKVDTIKAGVRNGKIVCALVETQNGDLVGTVGGTWTWIVEAADGDSEFVCGKVQKETQLIRSHLADDLWKESWKLAGGREALKDEDIFNVTARDELFAQHQELEIIVRKELEIGVEHGETHHAGTNGIEIDPSTLKE